MPQKAILTRRTARHGSNREHTFGHGPKVCHTCSTSTKPCSPTYHLWSSISSKENETRWSSTQTLRASPGITTWGFYHNNRWTTFLSQHSSPSLAHPHTQAIDSVPKDHQPTRTSVNFMSGIDLLRSSQGTTSVVLVR
jgi:hypothetical protein